MVDSVLLSNTAVILWACSSTFGLLCPDAATVGVQVIRDPINMAIKSIETREFVLRMASPRLCPVLVAHLSLTASNPPIGGLE